MSGIPFYECDDFPINQMTGAFRHCHIYSQDQVLHNGFYVQFFAPTAQKSVDPTWFFHPLVINSITRFNKDEKTLARINLFHIKHIMQT